MSAPMSARRPLPAIWRRPQRSCRALARALPRLVEDALIAQAHPKPEQTPARRVGPLGYGLAGGGLVALGVVIGAAL